MLITLRGALHFQGENNRKKCSPCLVILGAFLLKGGFDGDEGVCLCGRERGELVVVVVGGVKTETGMEQGTWVYMAAAAAVGAGPKINKSDSLYLSA